MAIKEIFHFDEHAYKAKVHTYGSENAYHELAKREVFKRRRIYSSGVKIVLCSILLVPTCGSTGLGLFIGLRQRAVAKQKYQHVVEAMRVNGLPLPAPKKRDKLIPLAINIVIYSLTLGLMYGLEEVGINAANETASYGLQGSANLVDPSLTGEAHAFVGNPHDFISGLMHGAHTQASELHGLITPDQTMVGHALSHNLEQPLTETSYQYLSGETAGAQLAPHVERLATVLVASEGMERMAKKGVEKAFARKPVGDAVAKGVTVEKTILRKPVGSAAAKGVIVTEREIDIKPFVMVS